MPEGTDRPVVRVDPPAPGAPELATETPTAPVPRRGTAMVVLLLLAGALVVVRLSGSPAPASGPTPLPAPSDSTSGPPRPAFTPLPVPPPPEAIATGRLAGREGTVVQASLVLTRTGAGSFETGPDRTGVNRRPGLAVTGLSGIGMKVTGQLPRSLVQTLEMVVDVQVDTCNEGFLAQRKLSVLVDGRTVLVTSEPELTRALDRLFTQVCRRTR